PVHAGRGAHRDRHRLLADHLVVGQVGTHRRGEAGRLHPAVRGDRVRADHPVRRAVYAARPSDHEPAAAARIQRAIRPPLQRGSVRRRGRLPTRPGAGRRGDPPARGRRGGPRVKWVFLLCLLAVGGAGGLMVGLVGYRWLTSMQADVKIVPGEADLARFVAPAGTVPRTGGELLIDRAAYRTPPNPAPRRPRAGARRGGPS